MGRGGDKEKLFVFEMSGRSEENNSHLFLSKQVVIHVLTGEKCSQDSLYFKRRKTSRERGKEGERERERGRERGRDHFIKW